MCFKYKSYNEDYSTNDDEEKSQIEYDIKNIFKSEKSKPQILQSESDGW